MKQKCVDCENTYHPKDDYCRKCEFEEAKQNLYVAFLESKIGRFLIKILNFLAKILE